MSNHSDPVQVITTHTISGTTDSHESPGHAILYQDISLSLPLIERKNRSGFNEERPMKIIPLLVVLFAHPVMAATTSTAGSCQSDNDLPRILLLGSYHMANPGLDMYNLAADDVTTEKRQAEIEKLVNALDQFKPTRIAVEAVPEDSETLNKRYQAYLEGNHSLSANEIEQIGFRLARNNRHEQVHAIDARVETDDEAFGKAIESNPRRNGPIMGAVDRVGKGAIADMGEWLSNGSVGDMLYRMNSPEFIQRAHTPYIEHILRIRSEQGHEGADYVGAWYKRNLMIFANLLDIAESGDRIIVIYGQGHLPTLMDFASDHPGVCLVDSLPYLEKGR